MTTSFKRVEMKFLSLSQMFKLLLWASRQVRARVQTYNTFIQVLQVIMYHEWAVSHCDNVTIQYQPINSCSTLLCITRSDSMAALCVLPQIYWKLLPQLAHTWQVDLTSSDFAFNWLVFISSTCHLPFHTSFPESASGEQAVWSATGSPIAFLGKTKIPNFARHLRLTRLCLSASNKVDGDHDDHDDQDE